MFYLALPLLYFLCPTVKDSAKAMSRLIDSIHYLDNQSFN